MKQIIRGLFFLCLASSSTLVFADDDPSVDQGASNMSQEMCVEENTNDCIDSVCMTSSATDCQDQCQADAQDKCQQMQDE